MITSDEQISSPRLVCKQTSLYLHSLCVDIPFNSLPREIIDVTSDVSTCKGYPWVSKLPLPPQRLSLGIPMKKQWSKNRIRAGDDGKREKAASLSPSHRTPRAFIFPSPQPPYDTRRPLRRIVSKLLLWKYSLPFLEMADGKEASSAASYPEVSCL